MDKNEVPITQQTLHVSITIKISHVMLCREIITVSCTSHTKPLARSIQSAELLNVKAGTTCQSLLYLKDLKCDNAEP
jgi:hypothetical protein